MKIAPAKEKTPHGPFPLQINPAKCKKKLTPKAVRRKQWANNYIAEPKLDGIRYLFHIYNNGSYLTSRRISKQTGKFVEKQDKVPWLRDMKFGPQLHGTILDGEIQGGGLSSDTQHLMASDPGKCKYHVWDILFYQGEDLREKPAKERRHYLQKFFAALESIKSPFRKNIQLVKQCQPIVGLLNEVEKKGGEGIVIKDVTALYGDGWTKVPFEDKADAFITGFLPSEEGKYADKGWIGAIEVAQFLPMVCLPPGQNSRIRKTIPHLRSGFVAVVVGTISGFDDELRRKLSDPKEQKKHMGRIIEIEYKEKMPKTFRYRHIRFGRWRHDKNIFECVW